jgi:hypothetical protein
MHLGLPNLRHALFAGIMISLAPASAQTTGAIDGYTLGFVFDIHSSGLRPLVGIPGAAVLGAQLDAGVPIRRAFISPGQNYAIALTDSGVVVVTLRSPVDPPATAPLGFDSSAARRIALSPDGSAAAFYSPDEALVRIVTGLPDTPSVARSITAAAIVGTVRLLAITNNAAQLVAAVDADGNGSLIGIDADGNVRTLATPAHASALQFIGGSNDLLLADDVDDTVTMIQDVSGSATLLPVAGADAGIAGPIGLNASRDGKQIVVANGRSGNILVFDASGIASGPPLGSYVCPCSPAGLSRLNGNSVFLLDGISDSGPLWIFDGDNATPRVMFIPADGAASAGSGQ